MLLADSLIVIGLATVGLGTIHEADGVQEHTFWLRNVGTEQTMLSQGYTSCGCTTLQFNRTQVVGPGDSTQVTLRFNPQGKGGEFHESGTIVYGTGRKRVEMAIQGECITSEETLTRQFPIRLNDHLRLSADHFDLGFMSVGETKERGIVVLHTAEGNRQERIPIAYTVSKDVPKGLQHIVYSLKIEDSPQETIANIILDVIVK